MAPSHYLKQCGLIIKLINTVLWHLFQWIIIKDLKIPISKMRLKLICWGHFTSGPEIVSLFSSDNSFVCVMVVIWYLLSRSWIPLASVCSRGIGYPPHGLLGGNVPRTNFNSNWNWNWAAIPIPDLNWPQSWLGGVRPDFSQPYRALGYGDPRAKITVGQRKKVTAVTFLPARRPRLDHWTAQITPLHEEGNS